MPTSQQSITSFVASSFVITWVAVMMSRVIGHATYLQASTHHSIPPEAKKPLIEKYGKWAVNRAEALCPRNDVACVEREAKRSLEVYRQKRELW